MRTKAEGGVMSLLPLEWEEGPRAACRSQSRQANSFSPRASGGMQLCGPPDNNLCVIFQAMNFVEICYSGNR